MRKLTAFTLVEMLVVIGVVVLLIALLLPALNKARDMANRITCASNLRQIATATLMYTNENRGRLMRFGRGGALSGGFAASIVLDSYSAEDIWSLYTTCLGGSLGKVTINNLGNPLTEQHISANLNSYAAQLPVFRCPSNPNEPGGGQFWYAYYTGSANNVPVTVSKLVALAAQSGGYCGETPALWGDRAMYAGTLSLTNHWDNQAQRAAGGNVACVDGSVRWFTYSGLASFTKVNDEQYVRSNGGGNTAQAIPNNAIYFQGLDTNGKWDPAASSVYWGTRWGSPGVNLLQ